jgi:hypothetical protein
LLRMELWCTTYMDADSDSVSNIVGPEKSMDGFFRAN